MQEQDSQLSLDFLRARLDRISSQLGVYRLDPSSFEKLQTASGEALEDIRGKLYPWQSTQPATESLRDAWVRVFGDPNDPAVKAKIDATITALRDRQ